MLLTAVRSTVQRNGGFTHTNLSRNQTPNSYSVRYPTRVDTRLCVDPLSWTHSLCVTLSELSLLTLHAITSHAQTFWRRHSTSIHEPSCLISTHSPVFPGLPAAHRSSLGAS